MGNLGAQFLPHFAAFRLKAIGYLLDKICYLLLLRLLQKILKSSLQSGLLQSSYLPLYIGFILV